MQTLHNWTDSLAYPRGVAQRSFNIMFGGFGSLEQVMTVRKVTSQSGRESTAGTVSGVAGNFMALQDCSIAVLPADEIVRRINMSACDDNVTHTHLVQSLMRQAAFRPR